MNRNAQERFALNPIKLDMQRSKFNLTPEVKTTFNLGDLFPIGMPIEVLPGDTFQGKLASAIRMQSLVTSPFDNLHFDYYWFFVPARLCWNHWKEFCGENTESAWIPETKYTIPTLSFNEGCEPKSLADYFGIPTSYVNQDVVVNALPFRGFALIYNEWFRDENICPPLNISFDDVNRDGFKLEEGETKPEIIPYSDNVTDLELGGYLPRTCKVRDYFTSALPGPQKGPDVLVMDHLPIYFGRARNAADVMEGHSFIVPQVTRNLDGNNTPGNAAIGFVNGGTGDLTRIVSEGNGYQPNNWYVDGSLSINQLRLAFQIQKLYEQQARGGSRYVETLKALYGVTAPDASLQRPQYLGGARIDININQVVQTSGTDATPQGNIAGYSLTSFADDGSFIQSFTEHGYLYCVGTVRINQHTYQQGLHRMWKRKDFLDIYTPVLSSIGEQPIEVDELYMNGDPGVFGYQEAWAEYRYMPSICTAEMRSDYPQSLDSWHFADYYTEQPYLSPDWILEDPNNIKRAIAVQDQYIADQFFGDFHFNITATRPMPLYSIPGLIDHH